MLSLHAAGPGCRSAILRSLSTAPSILGCTASSLVAAPPHAANRPITEIPAPKGAIPVLGHLHQLIGKDTRGKFELFDSLYRELGPIVRLKLPFRKNIVLVYNPSAVEQVLRNDGQYPLRSLLLSDNMQYLFKDAGLEIPFSFLDGKVWKEQRALHHKQIRPANVHSYSPGINRVTDRLLKNLESSRDMEGYVQDIFPFINNWTMEGSAWITLGADLDLGKEDNTEAKQLQQAVKKFVQSLEYMTNGLPVYKIYPTQQYKQAKQSMIAMRSLGKKYLDKSKENTERKIEKGESISLIEQWMIEGRMSEEQCIMSACEMFAAGIDTTANYATFLLYELAKHPEVQEKICQQVVSVLGEEGEADAESLQKMPYLKDVLKEAHRVNPVAPGFMRDLNKDIEVMGYNIPAGTTVIYPYYIRKSDPDLCKNPNKFDPDRWSKDATDRPHPFSDFPFGFGPRACFGRRFAELELKVLLTKMCRRFDLAAVGDPDNRLPHTFVTIVSPGGPVKIMLSPRVDCR